MSTLKLEHISNISSSGNDLSIDTNGNIGIAMTPDSAVKLSVTGAIGTTNGTDAAPTHTFYSDPDTGMYRSGANALSFSTGGSNALTLNSSQNASFAGTITGSSSITATTTINVGTGGGFYLKQDNSESTIRSESQPIVLQTYASNAWQDRVTVTNAGNVGIGINSPTAGFRTSIKGDYSSVVGGIEFDSGGGDKFTVGHASATSPSAKLNVVGAGHLIMATDNTERVRIAHTTGNVGIGETSPENILHIKTSAAGGPQIELDSTSGTANSAFINFDGTSLQLSTQRDMVDGSKRDTAKSWGGINIVGAAAGSYIQLQTSSGNNNSVTTKMTVDKDGNVGIGVAPESTVKLEVNAGADGAVAISGRSDGGNGNNRRFNLIPYADGGGANYGGGLKIQTRDDVNVFHDRITVQSNGNVDVGTSQATTSFRINSNARNSVGLNVGGASATATGIYVDNSSGGAMLDIAMLGSSYGAHGASAGEVWFYSPDNINIGGATGSSNTINFLGGGRKNIQFYNEGVVFFPEVGTRGDLTFPICSISNAGAGNQYLHAQFQAGGGDMLHIHFRGYEYIGSSMREGSGGGYIYNTANQNAIYAGAKSGHCVTVYQTTTNRVELVIDTGVGQTSNRWGSYVFFGGTDTITGNSPLSLVQYGWNNSTGRMFSS